MLHCGPTLSWQAKSYRRIIGAFVMLAARDDHLTRPPVNLNLKSTGLTHLESEIRVVYFSMPVVLIIC